MKLKSLSLLLISLVSVFLMTSCTKDDDAQIILVDESIKIDIGDYRLLEESISLLPYLNKTRITFVDSFNNKANFHIIEFDLHQSDSSILYKYNVYEEGDTVQYTYSGEFKSFRIYNDSLNLSFHHSLYAHPYHQAPEEGYVADIIHIFLNDPIDQNIARGVFYHVVNQRTWPSSFESDFHPYVEFIGKKFTAVYYNDYDDPISRVFYNYEFGIISFTDLEGKIWRFEDFE